MARSWFMARFMFMTGRLSHILNLEIDILRDNYPGMLSFVGLL